MKASLERWDDLNLSYENIEVIRFDEMEALIRRLDQKKHTSVSLGETGKPALMIGGGKGDYVVLWMADADHWLSLKMGPRHGSKKLLTVGGQPGDYESELVVTLDQAIAAARYFFLHKELDPTQKWEP